MLKSKFLISSFAIFSLLLSCKQLPITTLQLLNEIPLQSNPLPYQEFLSTSVVDIINSEDDFSISADEELKEKDFTAEYEDHFLFFTTIDKTGSAIEEILEHDGYQNSAKYLAHWRKVAGDNVDWPDEHSTTYHGKKTALEHGQMKNGTGWFWYRSATQKADEYFSRAVMAWHKGVDPEAPEQKEAWEWIGRTAHFIQDVTVPHHTVTLARLSQLTHNPFEDSVIKNFPKYLPSKNYDGGVWNGIGPYPSEGKWGIYFEGKLPGEIIKNNANITRGLFKIAKHKADATNGNWDKVRATVVPMAAKSCAGLIVSFMQQVGEKP